MKTNKIRIALLILLLLLALALIGFTVYEIAIQGIVDVGHIIRAILILMGIVLTFAKMAGGGGAKGASPAVYRETYKEFIGNAFADDKKREMLLMCAIRKYQLDRHDRALRFLARLEPTCVNNAERYAVLFFKALCLDEMGAIEPAAACYERLMQFKLNSTVASNLGVCYMRMGRYPDAIEAYETAIDIDPDNAYPYNNIAQIYLREQEWEGALEYAELALERKANMPQAHSAKITAYAMMGEQAEYDAAIQKAAILGINIAPICAHLAQMGATVKL